MRQAHRFPSAHGEAVDHLALGPLLFQEGPVVSERGEEGQEDEDEHRGEENVQVLLAGVELPVQFRPTRRHGIGICARRMGVHKTRALSRVILGVSEEADSIQSWVTAPYSYGHSNESRSRL